MAALQLRSYLVNIQIVRPIREGTKLLTGEWMDMCFRVKNFGPLNLYHKANYLFMTVQLTMTSSIVEVAIQWHNLNAIISSMGCENLWKD
tara:strand:+ start:5340 stop:5609 length:270 start_codon:yes stop_codon:yes gene_type:complete